MIPSKYRYAVQLAPLIDVVFIVLAFILVYSTLSVEDTIEVDLPPLADSSNQPPPNALLISITPEGLYFLHSSPTTIAEIQSLLSTSPPTSIVLRPDKNSPAAALVALLQILAPYQVATQIAITEAD